MPYILTREGDLKRKAKARAKKHGVPFNIKNSDILIPVFCPVLGMRLERGIGVPKPSSPTIDRIIPSLGYVPGNIQVISHRANAMKNAASPEELISFAEWVMSNIPALLR